MGRLLDAECCSTVSSMFVRHLGHYNRQKEGRLVVFMPPFFTLLPCDCAVLFHETLLRGVNECKHIGCKQGLEKRRLPLKISILLVCVCVHVRMHACGSWKL